MAYRMLSGQVPFEGDSAIDILHKHCTVPPPPLDVLRPDLPRYVYATINKALSKKPEQRFSSVTSFVRGLKELSPEISGEMATIAVDSDPSIQDRISTEVISLPSHELKETKKPVPKKPLAPPKPAKKKSRAPLFVILALVIIGGGGTAGWWLATQQNRGGSSGQQAQEEEPGTGTETSSDTARGGSGTQGVDEVTTGSVTVTGLPEGGFVEVNGERQSSTAFELAAGTYNIRMSAPGRQAVETEITVVAGQPQSVRYTGAEVPSTGTVRVTGLPGGGRILVDGRSQSGSTFQLRPGSYTIRMTAPGYTTDERRITVEAGEVAPLSFAGRREAVAPPPAPAILLIRIRPWANVRIGTREYTQVSAIEDTLPAGVYTIRVTRDGFQSQDIPVNLREGQVDTLLVRMERNPE